MMYDEYDPNTLRNTRYGRSMGAGAANLQSAEFNAVVLAYYARLYSNAVDRSTWNGATSATKVAVAASAATAAEKAMIAAMPTTQYNSITAAVVWNANKAVPALGGRTPVTGGVHSVANIRTLLSAAYIAVSPFAITNFMEQPCIYLPLEDMQVIMEYNNNPANYKDAFIVNGSGASMTTSYNGLEIRFVPMPANTILIAIPSHLKLSTDLKSDYISYSEDRVALNADIRFVKAVFSAESHIVNEAFNVLSV
jgi:hypothetical protein